VKSGFDGPSAYLNVLNFHYQAANLCIIKTQDTAELAGMKLNQTYPGGALKFFNVFQNSYLDLEGASNHSVLDGEKIGLLCASLMGSLLVVSFLSVTLSSIIIVFGKPRLHAFQISYRYI
jgi:hypothetical protein